MEILSLLTFFFKSIGFQGANTVRVIGWIGITHVCLIIFWMGFHLLFGELHPFPIEEEVRLAQAGLAYYSNYPGLLGFDHGSKALIMILSIVLPIGLFIYLKQRTNFQHQNLIGLIAGILGFSVYGLSLILQAVTVEYAFELYRSTADEVTHTFAALLYEWAMLEGGLSVSMYIIANVCLGCWVIIHSYGLELKNKLLRWFSYIVGSFLIIGHLASWAFLMRAEQNMHLINEAVGILFLVWLAVISMKMIRKRIR
jgi:hypothetical protein